MSYVLMPSSRKSKKWMVLTPSGKKVHFGASGYSDYTLHGDEKRKERYISRHKSRENWSKSGIENAGFWARWLLWNKEDIKKSAKDIEKRFNIKIEFKDMSDVSDLSGSKMWFYEVVKFLRPFGISESDIISMKPEGITWREYYVLLNE